MLIILFSKFSARSVVKVLTTFGQIMKTPQVNSLLRQVNVEIGGAVRKFTAPGRKNFLHAHEDIYWNSRKNSEK